MALIALGSNQQGRWGAPAQSLKRAIERLQELGLEIIDQTNVIATAPLGIGRQSRYFNQVIIARTNRGPTRLLATLKRLEREAGRARGRRWGPRPLDLDIIHCARTIRDWPPPLARAGRLILPHPEAHRRTFVLLPLAEVAPGWRHPVLGLTPGDLLRRLSVPPIVRRRAARRA